MITNIIIIIALLAAAGHCKGRLDAIADEGIKGVDWHNKYDFTKPSTTKHWWYLGLYKPKFPEKFPFSTTVLVFLTDRWHRWQFFMLRCFYLAVTMFISANLFTVLILSFIIFPIIVGVFFESSYQKSREKFSKIGKNQEQD
jgi:hypothetical protein